MAQDGHWQSCFTSLGLCFFLEGWLIFQIPFIETHSSVLPVPSSYYYNYPPPLAGLKPYFSRKIYVVFPWKELLKLPQHKMSIFPLVLFNIYNIMYQTSSLGEGTEKHRPLERELVSFLGWSSCVSR